ncbi:MAG: RDD family protein [Anaerolineae bacterium]
MTTKVKDYASYELADIGTRFMALIIDSLILGAITSAFFGAAKGPGVGAGIIVGIAYHWYFLTRQHGQTPGKMLMKIRVIKVDGTPIDDVTPILRYIGYYINSAVIMLGWLWATWDDQRQGWHDKIANTIVVRAE